MGVNRAIPFGALRAFPRRPGSGERGSWRGHILIITVVDAWVLFVVACTTSLLRMARVALTLAREGWRNHPMRAGGLFNSPSSVPFVPTLALSRPPRLPVERSSD